PEARTASTAARMPAVTSAVVGTLALPRSRSSRSRTTASVLVPPTSTPRRRSPDRMKLLHRDVVELVPEGPRAGDVQSALAPPDGVAGEGDHRHPLAVAEALGRDGLGGLGVDHRDDVGDHGQGPAALQGHQVLVLD